MRKKLVPTENVELRWFERFFGRVTKMPVVVHRFPAKGVCCKEVIEAFMNNTSTGTLSTDAASAIVEHVWSAFLRFVVIDLVCA